MTPTLSDLRRLLEGGLTRGGPAIDRLPERTVEALATAHLPRSLSALDGGLALHYHAVHMLLWWSGDERLDLADPGTTRALLVAFALYRGFDPGEGGIGVMWYPSAEGWCLGFLGSDRCYKSAVFHGILGLDRFQDWHYAPTVAAEPNPVKALALAVAHVLAHETNND